MPLIVVVVLVTASYRLDLLPFGSADAANQPQQSDTGPKPSTRTQSTNIIQVHKEDAEMLAARTTARATIEEFWVRVEKPGAIESGFMIKAGLPTPGGSVEHIWVGQLTRNGDVFYGRLANDPQNLGRLRAGSPVSFTLAQVSDWTFQRNGRIVGNGSLRVLISRMPEAQSAKYLAMLEAP